jgi:hypothetical protein
MSITKEKDIAQERMPNLKLWGKPAIKTRLVRCSGAHCNPSTQEAEAEGWSVQGRLGCIARPCLKNQHKQAKAC